MPLLVLFPASWVTRNCVVFAFSSRRPFLTTSARSLHPFRSLWATCWAGCMASLDGSSSVCLCLYFVHWLFFFVSSFHMKYFPTRWIIHILLPRIIKNFLTLHVSSLFNNFRDPVYIDKSIPHFPPKSYPKCLSLWSGHPQSIPISPTLWPLFPFCYKCGGFLLQHACTLTFPDGLICYCGG